MTSRPAETLESRALARRLEEANEEIDSLRRELDRTQARELRVRADLVRSAQLATLGNLVRGVSHEINTPLGALASNHDVTRRALERLQRILEDEKVTEDELGEVRKIVRAVTAVEDTNAMAVERMKHVVKSLRTFGRPDSSEVDRVDLGEALQGTLDLLKHEIGDRITVEVDLQALSPVECYAQGINQVFMNLLMNAIQAMSGEGTLTLRTRREADRAVVEVEDTGTGIPEENLGSIFEPGFTTKGDRIGMGLGLLISSEIIDRHGGKISVTSQVGTGTTFTVFLPFSLVKDVAARPD